jgi:hypothetical protein
MSGTLDPVTFQARATALLQSADQSVALIPGIRLVDKWLNRYQLIPSTDRPPYRIARNGVADMVTGNVTKLETLNGSQLYQWATGGVWLADINGVWTACADPTKPVPIPPQPTPGGQFKVSNGQWVTGAGAVFKPRGVNVCYRRLWGDNQVDLGRVSLAALKRAYPSGLNFVRFACHGENPLPDPVDPTMRQWIADLTGAGIVVMIDLHYTGNAVSANDARSNGWLAGMASANGANPLVWYETQNEPHGAGSAISAMMRGQYLAIRSTGNQNPVLFCDGNPGSEITGMNPADFADMHNVGFDAHCYGWMTDQWQSVLASLGKFKSADGTMPIACLEFGDGGGSEAQDGNWQQNITTALAHPGGWAAWMINWMASPADCLWAAPFDGSRINPGFGQMVHDAIVAG